MPRTVALGRLYKDLKERGAGLPREHKMVVAEPEVMRVSREQQVWLSEQVVDFADYVREQRKAEEEEARGGRAKKEGPSETDPV